MLVLKLLNNSIKPGAILLIFCIMLISSPVVLAHYDLNEIIKPDWEDGEWWVIRVW